VLHTREQIGCVIEQFGIALQLGQRAAWLEQGGLIFGQEMAPGMAIEQQLQEEGPFVQAIQQILGVSGHPATMVGRY
jgi:hypothetical protein